MNTKKVMKTFYIDGQIAANIAATALHYGIAQSRVIELLATGALKKLVKKQIKEETK